MKNRQKVKPGKKTRRQKPNMRRGKKRYPQIRNKRHRPAPLWPKSQPRGNVDEGGRNPKGPLVGKLGETPL